MNSDAELAELVRRRPAERMLGEEPDWLPAALGRPPALPPSRARRRIVAFGATMTGVTLVTGAVLLLAAAVELISGGSGAFGLIALVLGVLLVATHWGWVHVAEITANSIETRHNHELIQRREDWLGRVAPYTRWYITTNVQDDGAIEIVRTCHRPVLVGSDQFTFEHRLESRERHSADEPGAEITERAEELRRVAAEDTERERRRYEAVAEAAGDAAMREDDRQAELEASRAASQALSDQINSNLREPPLTE